jgi:DNA-binding transcriptional LysR family regulator
LTVEGVGLSLLPAEIIEPEVRAGTLRILNAQPEIPIFPMFIAHRLDSPTSNTKLLINRIRASVVRHEKVIKI